MSYAKRLLFSGLSLMMVFVLWTAMVITVDVKPAGVNGSDIGFSTLNIRFHSLTGVNMSLYTITDWAGLVPILVCFVFGVAGLVQLIKRRSLKKVDSDIILSGVYYIVVIFFYLIFESIIINYRPVLIEGYMESSYPSSTTLLVLCVMPTLSFLINRRLKNSIPKYVINVFAVLFSVFMVAGRLLSGVHWLTDIIGAVFISIGLFCIYKSTVLFSDKRRCSCGISRKTSAS